LREAFLIQMDDFDRLLEYQLRRKLNPIVSRPVPVRRGRARQVGPSDRDRREAPIKKMGVVPIGLRPDTLVLVERF
jgi:hypothetical protein